MERIEFEQYLNLITDLIRDITLQTENLSETDFRKSTELKERIYFMMQEIGYNAGEAAKYYGEDEMKANKLTVLTTLKTARYNLMSELNDQMVYGIVKNDLPEIQQEITETLQKMQSNKSGE